MKKKAILPIVLAVLVAGVLLYHIVPRSFSQIMKESVDTDPAGVEVIDVLIIPLDHEPDASSEREPGISYTLTKGDPAFQDLMDLLSSRRYAPLLGRPEVQYICIDGQVTLSFDGAACLTFSGDRELRLYSSKHERYIRTCGNGEAFQQEILDLLLDAAARHEAAA